MKIEIKNRWNGEIIFAIETSSIKLAVKAALEKKVSLRAADLRAADLSAALIPALKLITPVKNLESQILQRIETDGMLDMGTWHTCETTHCRAGWYITVHPQGRLIESLVGPNAAGALIFSASYPGEKVPNFYAEDDEAMADIKARAAKETAKK